MRLLLGVAATAASAVGTAHALPNGLGATPQMGYNSWYDLMCSASMNETTLRARADFFNASGLQALGYEYIALDDCYIAPGDAGRDANGTLVEDPATFPSGMRALSDYVHERGFRFGVYTDRGPKTCAGRAAAQGHEAADAEMYANKWAVDYLKEDSCNAPTDHATAFAQYGKMRDGLNATGRPIFFSLCGWNDWYAPVGQTLGNSWRIGPDDSNWHGIVANVNINAALAQYAGPGGWNDPCLLLSYDWTGKAIVTELQSRAQFSLWAVMASPLLISGNPEAFSDFTLATYANAKVIAVNQDSLGKQGVRIFGGDLVAADVADGGAESGDVQFPRVGLRDCAASGTDSAQQWLLDTPVAGFIQAKNDTACLNADDCQSDVIVYNSCPTTGCCNDCDNMVFRLNGTTGYITAGAKEASCLGHAGNGALSIGACDDSFAVKFQYDASTSQLQAATTTSLKVAGAAQCMTQFVDSTSTNVWARPLAAGAFALVFINTGAAAASVTCDETCFAAIGIKPGQAYAVEDLWNDVPAIPPVTTATFTATDLPGFGGHLMIRITPAKLQQPRDHQ